METDFLNFHDEEHFSVLGSESPQFEDRSSLIDSYSHYAFSRHSSLDYVDSTSSYFEDEEQEINGDIAVIPVSGQLDTQFPHLSSSPDCKDDFISEWHNFGTIECPIKAELNLPLSPHEDKSIHEDIKPENPFLNNTIDIKPNIDELKLSFSHNPDEKPESDDLPHLNSSLKDLVDIENTENELMLNPSFDLIPPTVKEFDLDIDLKEPFDLPSFINGDDNGVEPLFGSELETKPKFDAVFIKEEPQDDCDADNEDIDVETVSPGEQHPILEAGDVTSLLEQFEANEVNVTKPFSVPDLYPSKSCVKKKPTKVIDVVQKEKDVVEKIRANRKRKSVPVIPAMPNVKMAREKKSVVKKPAVVAPMNNIALAQQEFVHLDHDYCCSTPTSSRITKLEKSRKGAKINLDNPLTIPTRNLDVLLNSSETQSKNIENTALRIQENAPSCQPKTTIVPNRISKAANPPISLLKMQNSKSLIFKNGQNIVFNAGTPPIKSGKNGKLMVSVLKTNVKNNLINQNLNNININTVIETKSQDKAIQNITITNPIVKDEGTKKRKLNLEEYKRHREIKSCGTSRTNSPSELVDCGNLSPIIERNSSSLPVTAVGSPQPSQSSSEETKKLTPQELLLKMAADLLTTPAKSLKTSSYTIVPFTLPPEEPTTKPTVVESSEVTPPKPQTKNYEMKTIVSIGVNTTLTIATETDLNPSKNRIVTNLPKALTEKIEDQKLKEIITPILQNASTKINSNSLISNITETILQKNKPKKTKPSVEEKLQVKEESGNVEVHGEDKTIIVLDKNRTKPTVASVQTQTDPIAEPMDNLIKPKPQYRHRTNSSSSVSSTDSEVSRKNSSRKTSSVTSGRESVHSTSSESRYSRSRSRSLSPPLSRSSYSSYSSSSSSSSRSRTRSRSRSCHRRRSLNRKYSRSRYTSRNRSSYPNYLNYRRSKSPPVRSKDRKKLRSRESIEREKRQVNERRVIYVGNLETGTTHKELMYRFGKFGPIIEVKIHERSREKGGNYGFLTFQRQQDAYEAIERGNDDPTLPKYDISFGGRRVFCGTHYSDLDNSEAIIMSSYSRSAQEDSFDILLKEVQAKLRKRQV